MRSHIGRIAAGLSLAVLAQAQTSRGTVTGTVTDPSEGVVGSASVELVHIATGVRRRAITNAAGIYRFEAVDLGTYNVKIAHAGTGAQDTHFGAVVAAASLAILAPGFRHLSNTRPLLPQWKSDSPDAYPPVPILPPNTTYSASSTR